MTGTKHILRYGTVGDNVHIKTAINTFDYLAINANSAAYVSGAIAKFVVDEFFNNNSKGYFIDPITYAFQRNVHLLHTPEKKTKNEESKPKKNNKTPLKKSILKLINCYGSPADKVLNDITIQASDFNKNENLETFCLSVLDFQFNTIQKYITEKDMEKYLTYGAETALADVTQLHPKFLVAPYFYLDNIDPDFEKWLEINIKCIACSKENAAQYGDIPIFAQIVLSQDSLNSKDTIKKITDAYSACVCDGFTIWIDGLDEHQAELKQLVRFTQLLTHLRNKPIYNMYGGFFSILLTHKSINLLNGVSHGLEYGESRAVYPVGGGIPTSKYYFMPLHQRTDFEKAYNLLEYNEILNANLSDWGPTDRYFTEICKCQHCRKIMQNAMINFLEFESNGHYDVTKKTGAVYRRKKASPKTKENCLYHYLLCKKVEFSMVKRKNIDNILEELNEKKVRYEKCTPINKYDFSYIDKWNIIINKLLKANIINE